MRRAGLRVALAVALASGCGGVRTHPLAEDAPTDAPMDSAVDVPAPTTRRYVIDSMRLPTTLPLVSELGLDLNGDGITDNALGSALTTVSGFGVPLQAHATWAIDRGAVLLLPEVVAGAPGAPASFALFTGIDPMPPPCLEGDVADLTCRRHLAGGAMFRVDPSSARDTPLAGTISQDDTLLVGPGVLEIDLALSTKMITLRLVGARVQLVEDDGTGIQRGIIAGGVSPNDIENHVSTALASAMNTVVEAVCTGCACSQDSDATSLLSVFDLDFDCMIRHTELLSSGLLGEPDLEDGEAGLVSFGFGFTIVPAQFTP